MLIISILTVLLKVVCCFMGHMAFNENLLLKNLPCSGFNGDSEWGWGGLILWFHNTLAKRQWRRGDHGSLLEAGTSGCE